MQTSGKDKEFEKFNEIWKKGKGTSDNSLSLTYTKHKWGLNLNTVSLSKTRLGNSQIQKRGYQTAFNPITNFKMLVDRLPEDVCILNLFSWYYEVILLGFFSLLDIIASTLDNPQRQWLTFMYRFLSCHQI